MIRLIKRGLPRLRPSCIEQAHDRGLCFIDHGFSENHFEIGGGCVDFRRRREKPCEIRSGTYVRLHRSGYTWIRDFDIDVLGGSLREKIRGRIGSVDEFDIASCNVLKLFTVHFDWKL